MLAIDISIMLNDMDILQKIIFMQKQKIHQKTLKIVFHRSSSYNGFLFVPCMYQKHLILLTSDAFKLIIDMNPKCMKRYFNL